MLDPTKSTLDGLDVLDACHRETLLTLRKLADLIASLDAREPDAGDRATADAVIRFFSTTARRHHEDEERHVFPALLASGDPQVVQAVLRLQQDHHWMDVDWMELSPLIAAVAAGHDGYDLDALREGIQIFTGLMQDHIALEEAYIYPEARSRLRPADLREMGREMASRRRAARRLSKDAPDGSAARGAAGDAGR
jgi:hemerythrin-like domain-containing protein